MPTPQTDRMWSSKNALLLSVACLIVGIAGGWFIHGESTGTAGVSPVLFASATPVNGSKTTPELTPAVRLRQEADAQASPLLEKLKADPENPDLLINVGNLYYDAQLYPVAIDYYGRALASRPSDVSVRTDMGTAYWYMGNADSAISEFERALTYAPDNANTLFNLGLVRWKGKKDGPGALADWQKLLAAHPHYEGRDKIEQMMAEVKGQPAVAAK